MSAHSSEEMPISIVFLFSGILIKLRTPNQPLNIEVLCVNCQEKVNLQIIGLLFQYYDSNCIDEHSRMCYKATERSMQIDPSMNTEQPDFKLIRLKLALERQLETSEYSIEYLSGVSLMI